MSKTDPSRPITVEDVISELTKLLPTGLRPAALVDRPGLLRLRPVGAQVDDYALAFVAEELIREAIRALGVGPYGRAAAALFGATDASRGLTLRDRRGQAAEALNDLLPSTFRRNYESTMIEDIAVEIWRLAHRQR